ncbi:hypothetical protein, partial [Vibrio cidicii]|uniref:hypothetical protein n=1 Tax=Vibrio cidicii TaxID=1763883 RepID=UPI003703F731
RNRFSECFSFDAVSFIVIVAATRHVAQIPRVRRGLTHHQFQITGLVDTVHVDQINVVPEPDMHDPAS